MMLCYLRYSLYTRSPSSQAPLKRFSFSYSIKSVYTFSFVLSSSVDRFLANFKYDFNDSTPPVVEHST